MWILIGIIRLNLIFILYLIYIPLIHINYFWWIFIVRQRYDVNTLVYQKFQDKYYNQYY